MTNPETLLAVDTGLRTGLALYGRDGRLRGYRSRHLGTTAGLRRIVRSVLDETPSLSRIVLEGGGRLAAIWRREGERRGIHVLEICAETWRARLLFPRDQRTGAAAKARADALARRVIEWSGAPRPTSLRHDAAEAILVGLYGVLEAGWLDRPPPGIPGTG